MSSPLLPAPTPCYINDGLALVVLLNQAASAMSSHPLRGPAYHIWGPLRVQVDYRLPPDYILSRKFYRWTVKRALMRGVRLASMLSDRALIVAVDIADAADATWFNCCLAAPCTLENQRSMLARFSHLQAQTTHNDSAGPGRRDYSALAVQHLRDLGAPVAELPIDCIIVVKFEVSPDAIVYSTLPPSPRAQRRLLLNAMDRRSQTTVGNVLGILRRLRDLGDKAAAERLNCVYGLCEVQRAFCVPRDLFKDALQREYGVKSVCTGGPLTRPPPLPPLYDDLLSGPSEHQSDQPEHPLLPHPLTDAEQPDDETAPETRRQLKRKKVEAADEPYCPGPLSSPAASSPPLLLQLPDDLAKDPTEDQTEHRD